MFPRSSLKTPIICCTQLLIPFSRIYVDITLKPVYIGMCAWVQILLEFSLMWIQITYLLAFHLPQYHSDLTLNYPIEALYKEPLGYIEVEELKNKKTMVHYCRSLYLSLHPFLPWINLCSSQDLVCLCACYWEMEDWSSRGPGGGLSFSGLYMCR